MTCHFTYDDGAYVLGALSPAERAAFERHLPGCLSCRESMASLAVLPGLLGRLDAAAALPAVPAPASLLRRTLAQVRVRRRAQRRRRVWYAVASGLAAVMLATGVGVVVHLVEAGDTTSTPLVAMDPIADHLPVSAEVALLATDGGTKIDMTCRYDVGSEGKWVIRLMVFPRWGGPGEQVGTWTATSGQRLTLSAMTHLTPAEIDRLEIQRADSTPLLAWTQA
jgi:hypothetical protein